MSKYSVKKPYTVLVGVLLAIILGVVSFTRMTADLLPNISLPYVIVMTTYVGASPEAVETTVTQPVEASMATVSNIESIRSISNENYSMVILEFAQTADMNAISLEIRENLDQIKSRWGEGIGSPIIMKLNPDMLPIMIAAVGVDGMDDAQISNFVEENILPSLESVEGVASASATGLLVESVNVIIRQEKIDEVNEKIFAAIDAQIDAALGGSAQAGSADMSGYGSADMSDYGSADMSDYGSADMSGYGSADMSGYGDMSAYDQAAANAYAEMLAQMEAAKAEAHAQADMKKVITVDLVKGLLTAQNFAMPAGYVTEEGTDFMIRVGDKPSSVEDLQKLPLLDLHMENVPVITLGDVAEVFYTDNSDSIYANVDGSSGVMVTIQKQTGYSTGAVSDLLGEKFGKLMEEHEGLSIITLMDQGIYIDMVKDSIFKNIILGFGLAVIILILFLKDLRPTAVVAVSIPISLVTAVVCMYFSGVTLNIISLSGLALGIGMLVDNSIVVIENIYRLRNQGMDMKEAAIKGAKEVAGAIAASTLTTVCVFLPIVFTEGITRQLFVDMGLTIAFSLLASLAIALTVVPAMASKILRKTKNQKDGKVFNAIVRCYESVLKACLKVKPVVLIAVIGLLVLSAVLAVRNGTAFMPQMDSTQLTVSVTLDKEATLAETAEVTNKVVEKILAIDDVQNVGAMASGSTMSMLGGGNGGRTNAASIYVVTAEDKKRSNEEIAKMIQDATADLNAKITVDTATMDMTALGGRGITIQVRGRNLDELRRIAKEVGEIIEGVEGTANVNNGLQNADEELRILVDRDKAVKYGLTVAQVYAQIYPKLASVSSATTLVTDRSDMDVFVTNDADIEYTRALIKEMTISVNGQDGEKLEIPLKDIATFEKTESLTSINRANQTRFISVSAGLAEGYNIGLVSADVENALKDYQLPSGYQLVFQGENESINDALSQVGLMLVLAIVFMYLIMVAQFQSLISPFIIMFTIPLAFTGGLFGLFITGSEVSVIAMIGFVMLSGIIVNNGIVLIDYMNQLRENGMEKREAILEAGRTRLRPVLMTALTTILALSTMVISTDMGAEMSKPMAIVTIGGLIYGTLLTLIVIPCIYDMVIRGKKKKEAVQEEK